MQKQNVEQIIKDLATANFNLYPENYEVKYKKFCTGEGNVVAQGIAEGYWYNRTEEEVIRDRNLSIIKADYEEWVMRAYETYVLQVQVIA